MSEGMSLADSVAKAVRQAGVRAEVLPAPAVGEDGFWVLLVDSQPDPVFLADLYMTIQPALDRIYTRHPYIWYLDETGGRTGVSHPYFAISRMSES